MKLHSLVKIKTKRKKRLGRGESSGKGKTSGRGAKGQKKHEKVKAGFEGGQLPIYLRLPELPGVGNPPLRKSFTITTSQLNKLSAGSVVDEKNLKAAGLLPKSARSVKIKIKIVATKPVNKPLKVALAASSQAKKLILEAGGELKHESST